MLRLLGPVARSFLILLAALGSVAGQIPAGIQQRLKDKDSFQRTEAVKELAALAPSPRLPASTIASALAAALNDEDILVRNVAAERLGAGRPTDIAVPALLKALRGVDKDFAWARKVLDGTLPKSEAPSSSVMAGFGVATVPMHPGTILSALRDHQDERAISGVVEVLRSWKFERIAGITIQGACEELCLRRTQPALDAAVELLVRGKTFVQANPAKPVPDSRDITPKQTMALLFRPLASDNLAAIVAALDKAMVANRVEKPVGFDSASPTAWRDLVKANAARIPKRLVDVTASTQSGPASRAASEK